MPRLGIVDILTTLALVGSIAVGALAVWQSQPRPVELVINPPQPTATPLPSAPPAPIKVYITGAVAQPQTLLTLPRGSRVEDALAAVGGVLDTADLNRVNLAGILRDGDQVHVPERQEDLSAQPTPLGGQLVYVNRATVEELMTLPTIGRVTAEAIIAYREQHGSFKSLDDLDKVSGIGTATLNRIASLIAFDD